MEEKKDIKQFSKEDILQALLRMDEEQRENILAVKFSDIENFVNNKNGTYRDEVILYLNTYIHLTALLKENLLQLLELVDTESNSTTKMKNMLDWYEGFDSQQRLTFNAALSERNTLGDSINSFRYNWNKLISKGTD